MAKCEHVKQANPNVAPSGEGCKERMSRDGSALGATAQMSELRTCRLL